MEHDPPTVDLVKRAQQGDQRAFLALYERYARLVATRVLRLLGRRDELDDLVQEVFTQLYRSLERFDTEQLFEPWLYRITRNVVVNYRRKMSRTVDTQEVPSMQALGGSDEAWSRIKARDRLRLLYDALERFSEEEREAFLLHCVEGLTQKEVGEQTGTSENTVSTRVQRVRRKLFSILMDSQFPKKTAGGGES